VVLFSFFVFLEITEPPIKEHICDKIAGRDEMREHFSCGSSLAG